MKTILISDELHARLKQYTKTQKLLLGAFVEDIIDDALEVEERGISPIYQDLQKRQREFFDKWIETGKQDLQDPDYIKLELEWENYYNNKK